MSERRPIVVGIDVAEERKGLDLVALDGQSTVVASAGRLTVSEVAELVLGDLGPDLVCIDAPSGWSHTGRSRRSELELRTLGITAFSTPSDPGDHPFYRWIRVGIAIYRTLAPAYPVCDGRVLPGTAVEVFPEATAVLLTGRLREKDESKRVFRGQVLASHGVDVDGLPTVDRIDAALAALTGVLALEGSASFLGDPAEGVVLVPVAELPAARLRRRPVGRPTAAT